MRYNVSLIGSLLWDTPGDTFHHNLPFSTAICGNLRQYVCNIRDLCSTNFHRKDVSHAHRPWPNQWRFSMPGMENPDWPVQRLEPAELYTTTRICLCATPCLSCACSVLALCLFTKQPSQ